MATAQNRFVGLEDASCVLSKLRHTEATLSSELAALRQALVQIEALLSAPPPGGSLLTVAEAAQELRVSRTRVFQLLASGELNGVRIGRTRCVPRRSIDAYLARLGAA